MPEINRIRWSVLNLVFFGFPFLKKSLRSLLCREEVGQCIIVVLRPCWSVVVALAMDNSIPYWLEILEMYEIQQSLACLCAICVD